MLKQLIKQILKNLKRQKNKIDFDNLENLKINQSIKFYTDLLNDKTLNFNLKEKTRI